MDQVSEIVARLYTEWSYPEPIADMAAAISSGYLQQGDPRFFAPLYWPERRNLAGTKILIAGCGTNQAAYYAMRLPETSVTAIDLSLPSLQHTQFLKERHGLDNLNLRQMNLLDVARLDSGPYDLIVSTGVLHHLPDPDVGLRALRDVLAPDGVMNLMVYGRYLRVGVYMLQEAFRRLGCSHSLDDVALVRATLQVLPPHHSVHGYVQNVPEIKHDVAIADSFLHPQDRAYTVPEVLSFARDNGLAFWDWLDRQRYKSLERLHDTHPLKLRLVGLPEEDQWAVDELLTQRHGVHNFILCHPLRASSAGRINFNEPGWLDYVPVPHPLLTKASPVETPNGMAVKYQREQIEFVLTRVGAALMRHVNGNSPIQELLLRASSDEPGVSESLARSFFHRMWQMNHLMYWLKPK